MSCGMLLLSLLFIYSMELLIKNMDKAFPLAGSLQNPENSK